MLNRSFALHVVLALVGCILAAYVGDELLGGEALGWIAGGAILAVFCAPLFRDAVAYSQRPQP